jgi:hypothetical protein
LAAMAAAREQGGVEVTESYRRLAGSRALLGWR